METSRSHDEFLQYSPGMHTADITWAVLEHLNENFSNTTQIILLHFKC